MTTVFDRPLNGYRFIETRRCDTLQLIAARELGDASRWPELIAYNGLVHPYITDDEALAVNGVLLSGSMILVPAAAPAISSTTDPEKVFGTDVYLENGKVAVSDGDFDLVSGLSNFGQAIRHRIETERGELIFHTDYGSFVRRLIGAANGPTAALLAAQYAKAAVLADQRVRNVVSSTADVSGDVVNVSVVVEPVSGSAVTISATP